MAAIADKTLADLGWGVITAHLARRCATARAAEVAEGLRPDLDEDGARRRMDTIEEIRQLAEDEVLLRFGGITDVESAVLRADKGGVLADAELVAVAGAAAGFTRLWRIIARERERAPLLATLAADVTDFSGVYEPIRAAYGDDGRLADHASEDLRALRREVVRLSERLRARMDAMTHELEAHLQDRFFTQRGDRFVVPVRISARSRVPGIVHGTSQSGQTVFVEPSEIVDAGNQLTLAECAVADEEERIRASLSALVAARSVELVRAGDAVTYVDLLTAGARLASDTLSHRAEVSSSVGFDIRKGRHPHLVLAGKACVANDIALARGGVLVVSGPNAGGKTVALKTAGLAALMVRAGLHVLAAPGSTVPFFTSVLTDIGDAQSLEQDLSTFTGHLENLKRFLGEAGGDTLLLVDEIAVGTEPEQGAALAQAVLETLAGRGATMIVTTHYERLKELAAERDQFANASVGFDMRALRPTFELHLGVPGSSGALIVARQLGLPGDVIARAESLLGTQRTRVEELVLELATERDRLVAERESLAEAQAAAERERARAEVARADARAAEKRAHEVAHDEAVVALRAARAELERVRTEVRARRRDRKQAERAVDGVARAIREHAPQREVTGRVPDAEELTAGTPVEVVHLGGVGEVLAPPERGQVTVRIGGMKTVVKLDQVRLAKGRAAPSRPRAPRPRAHDAGASAEAVARTPEATLDVRGARVDEALDAVDRFIDDSLLAERDAVVIIHGHGTGALRKAIRDHIRVHQGIASSRPGERSEGGDGVTVAFLA